MKKVKGGLYLVLDPSVERNILLEKLKAALEGGVKVLQIWNNWKNISRKEDKITFINEVVNIANEFNVPVLINNDWEMIKYTDLSGVHFDSIPESLEDVKNDIGREIIVGITCVNDLKTIEWADNYHVDYISFCSLFSSKNAGECEIVKPETIQKANEITDMPLFVSGGVTPINLMELKGLGVDGVAVISGVLESTLPTKVCVDYVQTLKKIKK